MGNLTIGLDDKDEARLRRLAKERFEGKKGSISKTISIALDKLEEESKKDRAIKELIEMMDKGFDMGKNLIKHRSELYDRK